MGELSRLSDSNTHTLRYIVRFRSSLACALTHPHLADIGQRHEQWFKRSVSCSCRCHRCIRPPVDRGCPRQARAGIAVNRSVAKVSGGLCWLAGLRAAGARDLRAVGDSCVWVIVTGHKCDMRRVIRGENVLCDFRSNFSAVKRNRPFLPPDTETQTQSRVLI